VIIIINNSSKSQFWRRVWPGLIGLAGLVALWNGLAYLYEPFILPSPLEVAIRFNDFIRQNGALLQHFRTTFNEALFGFLAGVAAALPISYFMYRHPVLNQLITPYIIGIQAVPIVALAPLLVIWFGYGPVSKVLIAALVAFFPVLTNAIIGLKEVDPRYYELLTIMGAKRSTIFYKLELPAALPVLFGGLKMGLTLAVIGAVVGEFAGSGQGLGYLVNLARGSFDTPLIFIALIALALLGIGFYGVLSLIEYWVMPWKRKF